jgi:hypothetical protein
MLPTASYTVTPIGESASVLDASKSNVACG